eukprot:TRINITY_DN13514_c0_g1_i3.p1 TRINITY_DN13514_c0_g1~~TRINITY_DN13514_c0_g1_i3.p1  ORF type:complete len:101 (-),score=21.41 TRINITY_DN13514_c0_g1_i3:181-483(-)
MGERMHAEKKNVGGQTKSKDGAQAKPSTSKSPEPKEFDGGKRKDQIDRKERQREIKQVLAETMSLTNTLKEQLRILEKRGINLQGTNITGSATKVSVTKN